MGKLGGPSADTGRGPRDGRHTRGLLTGGGGGGGGAERGMVGA